MLERCQREIEFLEHFLKEPEYGKEIEFSERDCSQVSDSEGVSQILVGTKTHYDFQTNDMLADTTEG